MTDKKRKGKIKINKKEKNIKENLKKKKKNQY